MGLWDNTLGKFGFVRQTNDSVQKDVVGSQSSNWDALFSPSTASNFTSFNSLRQQMAAYTDWVYTAANVIAIECATIDILLYVNRTQSSNATLAHKLVHAPKQARKYMERTKLDVQIKGNGDIVTRAAAPTLEEIESHPLIDLLNRPNPFMTRNEFFEMTFLHMELTGDAFWAIIRDKKGQPAELWPMMPNLVRVIPDSEKFILGYTYTVGGQQVPFDPIDVVHHKYSNPNDFRRGMSTVMAAARAIDTDAHAADYNRKFFYNSAQPDAVLQTAELLDDEAFKRVKEQFNDLYGGTANAHRTAVLENGLEYKAMNLTQKEMDFLKSREFNRDMILAMFHVPKSVIGLDDGIARAQAETAEYVFSKSTIRPKMERLVSHITNDLAVQFDKRLVVSFTDPVPADKEYLLKERSELAYTIMTPNEIRADMGLDPVEGGDQLRVNANLVPLDASLPITSDNPDEPVDDDQPEENEDDKPDDGNEGGGGSDDNSQEANPPGSSDSAPESDKSSKAVASLDEDKGKGRRAEHPADTRYKSPIPVQEGCTRCKCCSGYGEHDTGFECYRCDASGSVTEEEAKQPIPCGGRADSDEVWVDEDGNYRHAEERAIGRAAKKKVVKADDTLPPSTYLDERDEVADKYEPDVFNAVVAQTQEQEQEVLRNLSKRIKGLTKNQGRRVIKANLNNLFDPDKSQEGWLARLSLIFEEIISAMGLVTMEQLQRVAEDMDLPDYEITPEVTQHYEDRIRRISVYFDKETQKQLGATLMEGIDLGESVDELRKRVKAIYAATQPGDLMWYRAERIARTEPIFATTWTTLDAWKKSGIVSGKQWHTAGAAVPAKNNPCPFCRDMNGRIVDLEENYFDQGATYTVDDDEGNSHTMKLDYVNVIGPPIHPSCRCTLLPVMVDN